MLPKKNDQELKKRREKVQNLNHLQNPKSFTRNEVSPRFKSIYKNM